jgi:malonate transporter
MGTVLGALLPLIVTLGLGFFAAWRHEFSAEQASVLNKMVLVYAVPLLLFSVTVTIKRGQLTSDLGLAAAIAVAMIGVYLSTFVIARFPLKRSRGVSALTALAIGGPGVPFAGVVVLGYLFGAKVSALPIAVGSLVFNVVLVPVTLLLLALDEASAKTHVLPRETTLPDVHAPRTGAMTPILVGVGSGRTMTAAQPQAMRTPDRGPTKPTEETALTGAGHVRLVQNLISTAKQPIVWASILALVLVLAGISFPQTLLSAMKLLGSASTGVALFASGIVLYAQRIAVTRFVIGTVLARNVIVPAVLWVILAAIGMPHMSLRLAVLTLSLPAPVACVIFAVRYNQGQREMASTVLFSSVLSILTVGAFIALT